MGLVGGRINLALNNWSYAGIGMYGAVTGERGGLFTLGVNAGIKKAIVSKLYIHAGLHVGGGGGANEPRAAKLNSA